MNERSYIILPSGDCQVIIFVESYMWLMHAIQGYSGFRFIKSCIRNLCMVIIHF